MKIKNVYSFFIFIKLVYRGRKVHGFSVEQRNF